MKKFCVAIVILMLIFCSFSILQAGTFGWYPQPGDAIYRDMDRWITRSIGHAGLYIGQYKPTGWLSDTYAVHMQKSGCEMISFFNFESGKKYWGAMYSGDWKIADKRVKEAIRLYNLKKLKYDFFNYKSFDSYKGRCEGLVEWCSEKAGKDILNDYHWSSSSPQMQWKSVGNMSYRVITADGEAAFKNSTVPITGWILF